MIGKLFKLTFALLGAGITYFIYQMAFKFPQIVEVVYSRGIYPFFTKTIGRLSAALPFSLAEVLLYLFLISILFFIGYIFSAFFKPRGEKLIHIGKRLLSFISLLCSLYTMFILFWGINYARMPLADSMGLSTEAGYTVSDLQALCQYLIEECNTLRDQVEEDEQGVYRLSHTKQAVMESMYNLYNTYAPAWMNLAGQSVVKGVATPNLLIQKLPVFIPLLPLRRISICKCRISILPLLLRMNMLICKDSPGRMKQILFPGISFLKVKKQIWPIQEI